MSINPAIIDLLLHFRNKKVFFSFFASFHFMFLYALVFLYDSNKFTMPLGLVRLYTSYQTSWDEVMAASVIITVPIVVLFLTFEKYLQQGLVAGGVKG